jgi:hypothetical protein
MEFIQDIGRWLTSSSRKAQRKGHPDLYPLDVRSLCSELDLLFQAKRLGQAGVPEPNATALSGPEAAALQRVEKARQDYVDWAALRLEILNSDLAKKNIVESVNRARQSGNEFDRKASALIAERESTLRALSKAETSAASELAAFGQKHRLIREARYPSRAGAFFGFALLIFLVVFEGVVNSGFFSKGLDSGLIGGAGHAMILASFNVLTAYGFGRFGVRYCCHRFYLPRLLGIVSLVSAFVLMSLVALGIAHYRDALSAEAADPARVALLAFAHDPLGLRDFFSWALFAISIGFGVVALIDGVFADDMYPGYGGVTRRARQASDDYEAELEEVRLELEELKEDELRALDEIAGRCQASLATYAALIGEKHSAHSRLQTAIRDADNSLEALLQAFRTENQVHRGSISPPGYFNEMPALRPISMPNFSTLLDDAELRRQQGLVDTFLFELEAIRSQIQAAFVRSYDAVAPLRSQFAKAGA